MSKPKLFFNIDDIINNETNITKIRTKIRANISNIYLSEENLAKLESLGFSRSEILMAYTPKNFFSMSSLEVLRSFGLFPDFNKDIALGLMSKDYIINHYSELAGIGANIDINYIFSDISKELSEYYAEKLVESSAINCNCLLTRLNYRAIFFLTNILLLYGADPVRILKKLDPNDIETHRDTFIRYGIEEKEIDERIKFCLKTKEGKVVTYNGKNGHTHMSVPVKNIKCLNCKNNHVYYGFHNKNFCCNRCRETYIIKREVRKEMASNKKESKS